MNAFEQACFLPHCLSLCLLFEMERMRPSNLALQSKNAAAQRPSLVGNHLLMQQLGTCRPVKNGTSVDWHVFLVAFVGFGVILMMCW
jgi:hypothetical protein